MSALQPLKATILLVVGFSLAPCLMAGLARAELVARGDLFVSFQGGILPRALPRATPAPISVQIAARVRTLSGVRPPALRQIEIALNRAGRLDTRGLPTCPIGRLESASSGQALAACRAALIGSGSFTAVTAYPEQSAFPTAGRILAFNARRNGAPVILAHILGNEPVPIVRVVVFHIHRAPGVYGTVLTGALPASVNRYGYVEDIALDLHRTFAYRGRLHSYLSATCGAPSGFPGAVFPFARVSMTFADGRELSSNLTRSCSVRQPGRPG